MVQGRRRCSNLLKFFTSKHVLSEFFSVGFPGGNILVVNLIFYGVQKNS